MSAMKYLFVILCFVGLRYHAIADDARFDLAGPKIDARVTRGNITLPIAEVPNLEAGDRIWVRADMPVDQETRLLLIVAFLRETTNEPPDGWFTKIETWGKENAGGTTVTVPDGARAALLFVAPATGGGFETLRSAVRGRPGIFLRASAGLNRASFEQQRIERYLAGMMTIAQDDNEIIRDHSTKLARVLALGPNATCYTKPVEQQVDCLTQSREALLLDDGHGIGVAAALSTGASSDFINEASSAPALDGGNYSTYVGTLIDLVRLVSLLHTAQYQYIPAISFPQGSTLNLRLNAAPSFNNPKSVIVIGLPAVQAARLPPLKVQVAASAGCLSNPNLILPLDGAPLVFSTSFAHDLILHLDGASMQDIPLRPDAFQGGLVINHGRTPTPQQGAESREATDSLLKSTESISTAISGTVRGYWGFDPFSGPTLKFQLGAGHDWKLMTETSLLAGEDNQLTLTSDGIFCLQRALLLGDGANFTKASVMAPSASDQTNLLHLTLPMKGLAPGHYALMIEQYDGSKSSIPLVAYASGTHLDAVTIHEGDRAAVVTGRGLEEVASLQVRHQRFLPEGSSNTSGALRLTTQNDVTIADGDSAEVTLKDGRRMTVAISVEEPLPVVSLVSVDAVPASTVDEFVVRLVSGQGIPLNSDLSFVIQSENMFPRSLSIEVATIDGSVSTMLSIANGSLILQDERTVVAAFSPLKVFGESGFGKLAMRPVAKDGTKGAWKELGTLIRTPKVTDIQCTYAGLSTCLVKGAHLFFVQSFSASKSFEHAVEVPMGFDETQFAVPAPLDRSTIYLKLRDDPSVMATISLLMERAPSERSAANRRPK